MADEPPLHPTENRGYRELYVTSRGLARHWERLSDRIEHAPTRSALAKGVAGAQRLLGELPQITAEEDLHGGPAALGLGGWLADLQNFAGDRFLERNQAARVATLEVRHVRLLLSYLGAVGAGLGATARADFCRRWEAELSSVDDAMSEAVLALAADPDAAIEPVDQSSVGRAAQGVAFAVGSVGEWVDRQVARREAAERD